MYLKALYLKMSLGAKAVAIDQSVAQAQNWWGMLAVALGFSIPTNELLGGLFFACATASIFARHRKSPVKIFWMLATAVLFALLVALVWPFTSFNNFPVQLGMGLSGAVSWVVPRIMNRGLDRVEEITPRVVDAAADKFLPHDDEGT